MDTTDYKKDERLQWLRFVLNPSGPMPTMSDWQGLWEFVIRQAIIGICDPTRFDEARPDAEILYEWIGQVAQLRELNERRNRQTAKLVKKLKEVGFKCCILKGQGNGAMYSDAGLRTPGDIDVWMDASKQELLTFVKRLFPNEEESFKHIKFPVFKYTEVDLHYTPLKVYHPVHNRRLQAWINEKKEEQMTHYVKLDGSDENIAIPTAAFNAVYQLGHILIHLEDEGIGLRQIVDYYYVMRHVGSLNNAKKAEIVETWERIGLRKLAEAVMWVEKELLGLSEEYLLVTPNEKMGRLLAEDIMEGGNFGRYSRRQSIRRYGWMMKKCADAWHLIKLSSCFPGETFFRVVSKGETASRVLLRKLRKKMNI